MGKSGKRGMRGKIAFGLALLVALSSSYWLYRKYEVNRRAASLAARVPRLVGNATTLVPGVHMLGGLQPSAAYVIESPEGLILIDSGLDDNAGPLRAQMSRLGLNWKRIRAIFLTHTHGDHCGGAQFLRTFAKAKVYAGRDDAEILRDGAPRDAFFSTFYMPGREPHPTPVDVALSGDETIDFGNVRIRAIASPGHTPGSVCYLLEKDGLRVIFSGDVIMKLRGNEPPRYDMDKPLGTYSAYLAPRYRGDAQEYLTSLRRLRTLAAPDLLLPGHPTADPEPQSPALQPGRWEVLLDEGIRDMETLLARYGSDGRDFLDGEPKELLPGLFYLGDRQKSAVYGLFLPSKFLLIDAPGGPGLHEFVRAGLQRLGLKPRHPDAVLLTGADFAETSGLKDLIEQCHPQIFAPASGVQRVKEGCPSGTPVLPIEDLTRANWLAMTPIPLQGRGSAPIAYEIALAGQSILFSGRLISKMNQEMGVALFDDFNNKRGNVGDYLGSLDLLKRRRPKLWLPAVPSDGQNANLYDQQWERDLDDIRTVVERNRRALGTPGA